MQNKDEKRFTRKNGAMLVLTLCLVGAASITTYYALDLSDQSKTEEQNLVDLDQNPEETDAEAVLTPKAEANLADGATECVDATDKTANVEITGNVEDGGAILGSGTYAKVESFC